MKKSTALFLCVLLAALCFSGCATKKEFHPNKGLDKANVFFDDFTNGISQDKWCISNMKWGNGNGGVIYENVGYTANGEVVLACNGDLYDGDLKGIGNNHGRRTGASIRTQQSFGPGRFEVRLKCLPRFGSTTAFWTFFNNGPENHEIDIEINVENDFEYVWNTNWITVNDDDHYIAKTDIVNNDGEWHDYKFEWHTNPKRVDYYVDNILTHTSRVYVPTYSAPISIGNWFPDGWAGMPDFETDYTFLDWFRYTPYLDQPYDKMPNDSPSADHMYPSHPMEKPVANLFASGGFEGSEDAWKLYGENAVIKAKLDNSTDKELKIGEKGMAVQSISGTHKDFQYRMTGLASATGNGGYILIESMPMEESGAAIEIFKIDITEAEFKQKELVFKLSKAAKRLKVSVLANDGGTVTVDNLFMNLTKIYTK